MAGLFRPVVLFQGERMNRMQQYETNKVAAYTPMTVAEMLQIQRARKLGTYKAVPEKGMFGNVKEWFAKKTDVNAAKAETAATKKQLEQSQKEIAGHKANIDFLHGQAEKNKIRGMIGGTVLGAGGMYAHNLLRPRPNYIPHALAGGAALGLGTGMMLTRKKNEPQQY
jgi:hypothetical protein